MQFRCHGMSHPIDLLSIGTPDRDKFEFALQIDLIGKAIRQTRKGRNLTQEELGKLIGVQKSQISKLESNAANATMDTLMRVFSALKATVTLQIDLPQSKNRKRQKAGAHTF